MPLTEANADDLRQMADSLLKLSDTHDLPAVRRLRWIANDIEKALGEVSKKPQAVISSPVPLTQRDISVIRRAVDLLKQDRTTSLAAENLWSVGTRVERIVSALPPEPPPALLFAKDTVDMLHGAANRLEARGYYLFAGEVRKHAEQLRQMLNARVQDSPTPEEPPEPPTFTLGEIDTVDEAARLSRQPGKRITSTILQQVAAKMRQRVSASSPEPSPEITQADVDDLRTIGGGWGGNTILQGKILKRIADKLEAGLKNCS